MEREARNREKADGPTALVFFAVREEARLYQPPASVEILVTGMGRRNTEHAAQAAFARMDPAFVLTCGFAGGLNPALRLNDVVFDADDVFPLRTQLIAAGAKPARFHCADRIAASAAEKAGLRQSTGADAVEMESAIIRELCHARDIPSATVRVISDTADEDMPLDFNTVLTPELSLSGRKLALALLRSPGLVPKLLSFQQQTATAAQCLGKVLRAILPG